MTWQEYKTTYNGLEPSVPELPTSLNWKENKRVDPILLALEVNNNCRRTVKVQIQIVSEDGEPNTRLPLSGFKMQSFGGTY